MREIKFRAWDKSFTGRMWYWGADNANFDLQKTLRNGNLTVMQFTGLKDKNGKEIYEGDVASDYFGVNHLVEWVEEEGNLKARVIDRHEWPTYRHFKDLRVMEVIGNIYENPELLK